MSRRPERHPPRGGRPPPRRDGGPPKTSYALPQGDTEIVHGLRAALAVIERRPDDVRAIAFAPELRRELDAALRFAAARRIPAHEASEAELTRAAEAPQHEGICVTTRTRRYGGATELEDVLLRTKGACVALDRVRNPYNIGAIVRTAAFFGVEALLLGAPAPHPGLPPMAVRVAEGGAEHLFVARTTDLGGTLERLRKKGIRVVGGESDGGVSVFGYPFARPTVLVLGHEREGLGERVRAQCDAMVAIPGSGVVGSLNVGVATGILMAELMREKLR